MVKSPLAPADAWSDSRTVAGASSSNSARTCAPSASLKNLTVRQQASSPRPTHQRAPVPPPTCKRAAAPDLPAPACARAARRVTRRGRGALASPRSSVKLARTITDQREGIFAATEHGLDDPPWARTGIRPEGARRQARRAGCPPDHTPQPCPVSVVLRVVSLEGPRCRRATPRPRPTFPARPSNTRTPQRTHLEIRAGERLPDIDAQPRIPRDEPHRPPARR